MFEGGKGGSVNLIHGIIILLLILILWKLYNTSEKLTAHSYVGSGLDNYIYTSGATMRRLGQVFSQPGQGIQTTVYNAQLSQDPNVVSAQGVPVVMYLDSGRTNKFNADGQTLYNQINHIPLPDPPKEQ